MSSWRATLGWWCVDTASCDMAKMPRFMERMSGLPEAYTIMRANFTSWPLLRRSAQSRKTGRWGRLLISSHQFDYQNRSSQVTDQPSLLSKSWLALSNVCSFQLLLCKAGWTTSRMELHFGSDFKNSNPLPVSSGQCLCCLLAVGIWHAVLEHNFIYNIISTYKHIFTLIVVSSYIYLIHLYQ